MTARVIVTGGAGYIGSHAAKLLASAGFEPVTLDNLSRGHASAVKWGPLERLSLEDAQGLDLVFERYRPVAVMHFAAYAYVGESTADPYLYYRNNVVGTVSLLEAMRRARCNRIVFSSTCATYGAPGKQPIDEACAQAPLNPYGASKLMVERMLRDADIAYGLKSISLRYFNAAGADPDGEIGENHEPETHLIPLALRAASGKGDPLTVFGDDYPTRDGSCIRDYIHVSDLASAHVLALNRLLDGGETDIFNLGTENGHSVFEVISTVEAVTGSVVRRSTAPRRAGDPPTLVASAAKARTVLGWQPERTELRQQIEDAWRWENRTA